MNLLVTLAQGAPRQTPLPNAPPAFQYSPIMTGVIIGTIIIAALAGFWIYRVIRKGL